MPSDDAAYLQRRAEAATSLASRATHPQAVRAHYMMAGMYLDRLHASADPQGGRDEARAPIK